MAEPNAAVPAPPIGASPVRDILFAAVLRRDDAGQSFVATSLPGHLLHCVVQGGTVQECNGRSYELRPGNVLWYHEDELVRGRVQQAPWVWYSVNFIAPELPPPSFESRLRHDEDGTLTAHFAALCNAWSGESHPLARALTCHARLHDILGLLLHSDDSPIKVDDDCGLWWRLESEFRRDFSRPVNTAWLEERAGCSAATISRACHAAVGLAPMQRIRQIRLSLARGLVQRSTQSFSEKIAAQIGYPRGHEFSRDFRRYFGVTPSHERKSYREE